MPTGCEAGLAESCSHVASVLFYIEAWNRPHGKLACTQVKCSWLLPTYVNKVEYARVKDIDFKSAKKLKENLDEKINSISENTTTFEWKGVIPNQSSYKVSASSSKEMSALFEELNQCQIKPVVLSVVVDCGDQFVAKRLYCPCCLRPVLD